MATIGNDPNGRRRILFVGSDGKRRTIRLGKTTKRDAETAKMHIERLVSASITGHSVDNVTADWLTTIGDDLSDKLANAGLIPRRATMSLGAFIADYIASRVDVKPQTTLLLTETGKSLKECIGADRSLASVTPGDADRFRLWLIGKGLSDATVRRRLGRAKQFFNAACRSRLIRDNPFASLKTSVQGNKSREYFVGREDAQKVIDACPDHEWRLIFALSRFGGLRCPSEHLLLTWNDIDWGRSRMRVRSPKTEHHEGHGQRWVPIFPELKPFLDEAYANAAEGATFLITRCRDNGVNWRTNLERIIHRAGLTTWPKLFQNLRATRATELAKEFPAHVAAAWLGHSTLVASKHYWQMTDADFERASTIATGTIVTATTTSDVAIDGVAQNPAHLQLSSAKVAQNPAQQVAELACTTSQAILSPDQETPCFPVSAMNCETVPEWLAPRLGLEPRTLRLTVARSTN
jgi:integrase